MGLFSSNPTKIASALFGQLGVGAVNMTEERYNRGEITKFEMLIVMSIFAGAAKVGDRVLHDREIMSRIGKPAEDRGVIVAAYMVLCFFLWLFSESRFMNYKKVSSKMDVETAVLQKHFIELVCQSVGSLSATFSEEQANNYLDLAREHLFAYQQTGGVPKAMAGAYVDFIGFLIGDPSKTESILEEDAILYAFLVTRGAWITAVLDTQDIALQELDDFKSSEQ